MKDMQDQLSDGGRSVNELQKMQRRLEIEKQELLVRVYNIYVYI
jgi:hypothetical protein